MRTQFYQSSRNSGDHKSDSDEAPPPSTQTRRTSLANRSRIPSMGSMNASGDGTNNPPPPVRGQLTTAGGASSQADTTLYGGSEDNIFSDRNPMFNCNHNHPPAVVNEHLEGGDPEEVEPMIEHRTQEPFYDDGGSRGGGNNYYDDGNRRNSKEYYDDHSNRRGSKEYYDDGANRGAANNYYDDQINRASGNNYYEEHGNLGGNKDYYDDNGNRGGGNDYYEGNNDRSLDPSYYNGGVNGVMEQEYLYHGNHNGHDNVGYVSGSSSIGRVLRVSPPLSPGNSNSGGGYYAPPGSSNSQRSSGRLANNTSNNSITIPPSNNSGVPSRGFSHAQVPIDDHSSSYSRNSGHYVDTYASDKISPKQGGFRENEIAYSQNLAASYHEDMNYANNGHVLAGAGYHGGGGGGNVYHSSAGMANAHQPVPRGRLGTIPPEERFVPSVIELCKEVDMLRVAFDGEMREKKRLEEKVNSLEIRMSEHEHTLKEMTFAWEAQEAKLQRSLDIYKGKPDAVQSLGRLEVDAMERELVSSLQKVRQHKETFHHRGGGSGGGGGGISVGERGGGGISVGDRGSVAIGSGLGGGLQIPNDALCVACCSNPKSIVLLPCRHFCLCANCARTMPFNMCPLCRSPVQNKMSVEA